MSTLVFCERCQANHCDHACPEPRKAGHAISSDGESVYAFAIFTRDAAVNAMIDEYLDHEDLALALAGMSSFSRGPGRAFGGRPYVKIGKRNVMVRQYRGLDI